MDGTCRRSVLAAAFLAVAALAHAGNGIRDIVVRTEPNLTSVAVQAIVSGDDDSSAVLRLFQKWADRPAWDSGMVLVRRVGTNLHEGRILWMAPGREAQFYVQGLDAGGGWSTPVHAARVDGVRARVAGGPVFYADQRRGDDARDGASPLPGGGTHGPKRSIGAPLLALAASANAGRDGGVFVAPGEYHERLTLDFGSDGDHHFLAGDGTDRDSTIVCGANPWVEQGVWAPGQPLEWAPTEDSTWVTRFDGGSPGSSPGDSTQLVVLGWGEYLHRKTSLGAVLDDSTFAGVESSTNEGELSGWFWRNDSLYVKRRGGGSPAGLVLHTGYLDALVDVRRRNWHISGLTFRFAGGASGDPEHPANPSPPLFGHGIQAGLNGTASGLVVDSCRFYGLNADPIYVVHGAGGFLADSVTIAHCLVDGLGVGDMAYGAGKSRVEERVGQITLLSRAANVYGNVITGAFNGLQVGPGSFTAGPADSTWGSQVEIADNSFARIADDAIELDTSHAINTLLVGNLISDAGHGISQVPIYTGPVFAFYNTIVDSYHGGLKVGSGSTGIAWYAHNTIASSRAGGWAVDGSPGGAADHLHFRNNVLSAAGNGTGYTVWGPAAADTRTSDFNYDLVDTLGVAAAMSWGGRACAFAALPSVLGWEANGVRGSPMFVDPIGLDWGLSAGSPGVGAGQRLAGVNTSLDGPRYEGQPDVGAPRSSPGAPTLPQPVEGDTRLGARPSPNPFHDDATLEFTLPEAADVTVRLFDPAGRVARVLLDGVRLPAGNHRLALGGLALRPGLYLYQVRTGRERVQGKLVLIP